MSTQINLKYYELKKLFQKMTHSSPDQRPNCEEILEEKHLWASDENEFDLNNEIRVILKSEEKNETKFVHSILEF
jgi:hypothetical protein